ncbi:MAG: hypothetical protein LBL41_02795 [Bifidobacteriaceae bacterium]|jgi:hypothetical protein|nr:hypothetical protein [Bifidobacteriaceae bacterium]
MKHESEISVTEFENTDNENALTKLTAMPVRIIPFDLGCTITKQKENVIAEYVKSNGFLESTLSTRSEAIFTDVCVAFSEIDSVHYYVFTSGICVCVIFDDTQEINENNRHFAIEYCVDRKVKHEELFAWKHKHSSRISAIIEELRNIVQGNEKTVRTSGLNTFEHRGLSYVMTLSLLASEHNKPYGWAHLPEWFRRNVSCMLDPEMLLLEDSRNFAHSHDDVYNEQLSILEQVDIIEPVNYETRAHLATFISWSAVLVFGNIKDYDIEEYVALEIELQKNWFYIYCTETMLESRSDNEQGKVDVVKLRKLQYELELYEDNLREFKDSSLPTRILKIQEGLLESSRILSNLNRVKRKLECLIEATLLEAQLKQKKLNQTVEILLFVIAYIQIAPIVFEFLAPYTGVSVANLLLALVALAGGVLLLAKDRG